MSDSVVIHWRSERIFCHDYQNSICRRPACKFLHYSREDEEVFRLTGLLPNELDQNHDGSNPNSTVEEMPPVCKDYLNGICSRGPACKYRHISTPMDKRPLRANMDNLTQFRLDHLPEDPNTALSSSRSAPMLSNQISSRGVIPLQPPTATALMAVATSLPSSDRSHPSQPLSISSNIVSASDSIATPMKDMYPSQPQSAVAAAKAFVARTTPVSSDHAVCSSDNPQCRVNNFQDSAMVQNSTQVKPLASNTDESQGVHHQAPACCLTATITTATMSTATVTGPQSHSHTVPPAVTSSHLSSSSSCFLHPNEEEEEQHAKTAAAVAAAACIGAMFSQPLGTASSTSSSVAAMLGDLMGQNHLTLKSTRSNHHSGEFNPQSSRAFPDDYKSEDNDDSCHANEGDSRTFPGDGPLCAHECNDQSSLSASHAATDSTDVSVSMTDGRAFSHSHMEFANSSAWSSVATTVASAAQAAAAAAVVATQAVTRSAKFYQLARKNQHQSEVSSRATSHLGASDDTTTGDPSIQSAAQSPPADPGRPSLSPNTAVTMTAAVMAAAAATAAAKQRRILSGVRHSPYAECAETPYIKQPRITLQPKEFSDAEDSEYSIACDDADRYTQLKRILKGRSAASMYGYVRLRRNSLEVDEDEEDPDAFEDDVATAMSMALSPEVTPPYGIPMKRKKHHHRDSMYTNQTDDSHPGSEYTSPSDTFDGEHYHNSRQNNESHIQTEHKLKSSINCLNHTRGGLVNVPISTITSDVPCIPETASLSTEATTTSNFSPLRPQRCRSQSITISSNGVLPASLRRAHSAPSLRSGLISIQPNITSDASRARPTIQSSIISGIAKNTREIAPSLSSPSANESHPLNLRTVHAPRSSLKPHLPVSRLAYDRKPHLRSPHIKPGILSRSAKSTKKLVVQQRSETRSQATASPDSIMTEDLSGHDDIDDPEFIDTEDYDDELFDLRSRNPSLKRPAPLGRNRWRIPGRLPTCSASMRQHHALRAENARLRRKLSELMRQRGDLRAANEILLEQNARLRHSSKRVSAVARMAESATKIIEAHSKSQLSQPAHQPLTPSVFPSVDPQMSQLTNRFSLTHAAAAAAAAAVAQQEQHSTAPTIHGVYVSSPTTSTTQQASQAVTALGGHHPIFPSAMVTGSVPGAIALSNSHQSLAAVQIRASTDSLVPTSVAPQPQNMVQQQSMDGQQHPVSSFYQHHLHPMGSLPGSITNITPHSNLAPASSAIQVCHYPIRSSGTVFPSLHQATAVTPSIVPIGASSAVTLLVGQAPTAYAPVGSSLSTAALHLSNTAKTEPTPVNVAPVPQLSYMYQGPSGTFGSGNQCLSANPLSTADTIIPSNVTNNVTAADHLRHLDTRPNIV
ncbi:zinc finger CCCH domain-containing protein 10 [Clonorchis sinensis]|uniref:Zinc finger CCCH domain-containing protein 10 n=1 Tax=Clonorchis sinensis TaxID=79923 RepID=G7YWF3_CLOSI|nr:zinc finger CCCH domain-containing protein 10 [Clonorchis sinensis]